MLLRHIDPSLSSGHHRLCVDGAKAKLMGDSQSSSIGAPLSTTEGVSIRGVGYEVLHISPGQTGAVCM